MPRRRVLYLFPTLWDRRQLEACRPDWEGDFEVRFAAPDDAQTPWDLDPVEYVERAVERERGRVDGVTSSSDYPGAALAAAVARRLGLPGPTLSSVVRCAHKLESRRRQRELAPQAVPGFAGVRYDRPGEADLAFPCFVKPVKGTFSQHARRIDSRAELERFLSRPAIADYCESTLAIFNRTIEAWVPHLDDGRWFVAEELLVGEQVTVEGYVQGGEVTLLGVVDSVMHPGTRSFARFDLPSRHPPQLVERMEELVRRVMGGMGLADTLFNVELVVDARDGRLWILEINPRICGQFGDLYAKVHGTHGYLVQLALAVGERPRLRRGAGPHRVAASVPLRHFEPMRVRRVPSDAHLAALRASQPDTLAWIEVAPGEVFDDLENAEDGCSVRYAVLNLGARDAAELERTRVRAGADLPFEFERPGSVPGAEQSGPRAGTSRGG
jgi:biotin carboxylase